MSGMKVFEANDIKVYNLTVGREVPAWLPERKRRELLKKDPELKRRVQLIQDFEFPTACNDIFISPDQEYVLASGTYKPRVRCFELSQMSMKFERHLNCEALKVQMLSDDYSKFALLLADRFIELHAAGGCHYRTRIPKYGRDLAYFKPTCDLLVAGEECLFPINLCEGRFKEPFTSPGSSFSTFSINPMNGLVGGGTSEGFIQCFDIRSSQSPIASLDIVRGLPPRAQRKIKGLPEVSALSFLRNGLGMAVGLSSGHVLMYDIRSKKPMLVKDHNYGLPVTYIYEHELTSNMMSVDEKVVKFWDKDTGSNYLSFEADNDINTAAMFPDSGLFFLGGEQSKIMSYFIPSLGPAPKWCGYLDTITEELDEDEQPVIYDDYKFVTKAELDKLELNDLIGTGVLRAYMHGFFVDTRLYNEALSAINPAAEEEFRAQRIKQKLEEGTVSRLQMEKLRWKLPKVNRSLAKKMMALKGIKDERSMISKMYSRRTADNSSENHASVQDEAAGDSSEKQGHVSVEDLVDSRFQAMFSNPDFVVDEFVPEYASWQPNSKSLAAALDEKLAALDDLSDESEPEGRGSDDEEEEQALLQSLLGVSTVKDDSDDDSFADEVAQRKKARRTQEIQRKKKAKQNKIGPTLQEDHDDIDIRPMQTAAASFARKEAKAVTFSQLLQAMDNEQEEELRVRRTAAGGKIAQMRIRKPGSHSHGTVSKDDRENERQRRKGKRGVGSLGLSKPNTKVYWRGRLVRK